jgi:hypothetical protein
MQEDLEKILRNILSDFAEASGQEESAVGTILNAISALLNILIALSGEKAEGAAEDGMEFWELEGPDWKVPLGRDVDILKRMLEDVTHTPPLLDPPPGMTPEEFKRVILELYSRASALYAGLVLRDSGRRGR